MGPNPDGLIATFLYHIPRCMLKVRSSITPISSKKYLENTQHSTGKFHPHFKKKPSEPAFAAASYRNCFTLLLSLGSLTSHSLRRLFCLMIRVLSPLVGFSYKPPVSLRMLGLIGFESYIWRVAPNKTCSYESNVPITLSGALDVKFCG